MNRSMEKQLQDYLDDRLAKGERERFEEILARDPELAARLRESTEMRAALRQGDEDLSPGFYTRARARFEESAGPRRHRWFRLLSWETAGLTAAVIMAAVLFVPVWMRNDLTSLAVPVEEVRPEKSEPAVQPISFGAVAEGIEDANELAAQDRAGAPTPDDSIPVDNLAQDEESAFAESPPPVPTQVKKQKAPAERPAAPRREALEERSREKRFAPVPPPATIEAESKDKGRDQPRDADIAKTVRAEESLGFQSEPDVAQAASEGEQLGGRADAPAAWSGLDQDVAAGVPLPSGLVEPGAVRVVKNEDEWEELLRGPAGRDLSRLGGFDPRQRLVLIGSRGAPLDCGRIVVDLAGEVLVIRLVTAENDGRAAVHGCGLALPREGSFVIVEPQ